MCVYVYVYDQTNIKSYYYGVFLHCSHIREYTYKYIHSIAMIFRKFCGSPASLAGCARLGDMARDQLDLGSILPPTCKSANQRAIHSHTNEQGSG